MGFVLALLVLPNPAAATVYHSEIPIELFGDLCQYDVPGIGSYACGPTAATNGFQILRIDLRKRNKYLNFKNVGDGSNAVTLGSFFLLHNADVVPFAQASGNTVKTAI